MNCKPGDLAVITSSTIAEVIGRLVLVKHSSDHRDGWWVVEMVGHEPAIVLDPVTHARRARNPAANLNCSDARLRPIRDQDGEDEMLRIAGKPKTTLLEECNRLIADFNKLAEWCREHQK